MDKLELSEEGKLQLRVDLAYFVNHETIYESDGIENMAQYLEDMVIQDEDGKVVTLILGRDQTRSGEVEILTFCGDEVQVA
jgi:hypothetical protein